MRFYKNYCNHCKTEKIFINKLENPQSTTCTKIVNICMSCNTEIKNQKKIKI